MRTLIISVILILLSCATVSAQADFLEKGTGGLEFALGSSHTESADTYLIAVGSTRSGTSEFGLIAGQVEGKYRDYTIINPSGTFYPIKQKLRQFLTVGLRFGVELDIMNTRIHTQDAIIVRPLAGGVLLSNAKLSNSIWVQPAVSATWVSGIPGQKTETVTGISLSIITKLPSHSFLRINPSVSFAGIDHSYSIMLGLILPK